jgi:uncharacterized protein YaaN involved in tellurite resistance
VNTDITPRLPTVEEDISNLSETISGTDTGLVSRIDALETNLENNYTTTEDLPDEIVYIGDQLYVPLTDDVTIDFDDNEEEGEQVETMNVLTSVSGFIKSLTEAFHTMDDTITTITEAIAYIPTWLKKIIVGFEDIATLSTKIGEASVAITQAANAITTLETTVNTDITPRLATVEEDISNLSETISGTDTGLVSRVDALETNLENNYTPTEDLPDEIVYIGDQLYVPLTDDVTIDFDDNEEEEQVETMNVLTSVSGFIKSLTEAFHIMDDTITTITEAIAYIPAWLKKIIIGFEDIATLSTKIGEASVAITQAANAITTLTGEVQTCLD